MFQRFAATASFIAIAAGAALPTQAAVSITTGAPSYTQNFDSLTTSATATPFVNDSTLAGWSLFNAAGAALTSYNADDGGSNGGGFKSFGSGTSTDRALGGLGSGSTYFSNPAPASGAVAGYIAAAFVNGTGAQVNAINLSFAGEEWRNGGNTSAQTMVFEYGFGNSFNSVVWTAPAGNFDFVSPVIGATAAAVDGNSAGRVNGLGGTLATAWSANSTLWLRWTERNDVGNDHALAIDNLTLNIASVPEPDGYALIAAGLAVLGCVTRRQKR